jgi:hypothetical protein
MFRKGRSKVSIDIYLALYSSINKGFKLVIISINYYYIT